VSLGIYEITVIHMSTYGIGEVDLSYKNGVMYYDVKLNKVVNFVREK